jgi:hypothetical protein
MRSLLVADGSMVFLNNVMNPQPKEHERELEGKGAGTFKAPPRIRPCKALQTTPACP